VTKHDNTMIEPWSHFWVFFNFQIFIQTR